MPEMATGGRALAVMRRDDTELLYEAWLYHHPDLRVTSVGMEITKLRLQHLIRSISLNVFQNHIDPEDVANALSSGGSDVVVFFIFEGGAAAADTPWMKWFYDLGSIGALGNTPPTVAYNRTGLPSAPSAVPIRNRPLPPVLEGAPPFFDPSTLTSPDLQCLAALHAIYHWTLASMVSDADPIFNATAIDLGSDANIISPMYNRFVTRFNEGRAQVFGTFTDTQKP
jgi:hypothetical protein